MKLQDIHLNFKTDKGTAHNYLETYDSFFSKRRLEKLNVLEIGVLFGGSLKMWEHYFENSQIYGIEDFSQKDGHGYYSHAPVIAKEVQNDLAQHERIKLLVFDCEDSNVISSTLKDLNFDIIIDDASHTFTQQEFNLLNYYPFLNKNGLYICEDIQSNTEGALLIQKFKSIYDDYQDIELLEMDPLRKSDDRIVLIRK
jgi:hypothetical protein